MSALPRDRQRHLEHDRRLAAIRRAVAAVRHLRRAGTRRRCRSRSGRTPWTPRRTARSPVRVRARHRSTRISYGASPAGVAPVTASNGFIAAYCAADGESARRWPRRGRRAGGTGWYIVMSNTPLSVNAWDAQVTASTLERPIGFGRAVVRLGRERGVVEHLAAQQVSAAARRRAGIAPSGTCSAGGAPTPGTR